MLVAMHGYLQGSSLDLDQRNDTHQVVDLLLSNLLKSSLGVLHCS